MVGAGVIEPKSAKTGRAVVLKNSRPNKKNKISKYLFELKIPKPDFFRAGRKFILV